MLKYRGYYQFMSIANIQSTTPSTVTLRVSHLLLLNRISKRKLASQMGLTEQSVGNRLAERRAWTVDDIATMADIFGVSTDYLFGREPMDSAKPVNAVGPAAMQSGPTLVAGAGLDPATSRL